MTGGRSRFSYATEQPKEQPEKLKVLAPPAEKKKQARPARLETGTAADALLHPAAYALPAQQRGRRNEEGLVKRTDVPREQLNVRIRPELKRAAAGIAGLQGMTLGDVVEAALIAYLDSKNDG